MASAHQYGTAVQRKILVINDEEESSSTQQNPVSSSNDITVILLRLLEISSRPLAVLSPDQCADVDTVRRLARKLYGTPEYDDFYANVIKIFASLKTDPPQPRTVGSFFMGCIISSNATQGISDVNPGCALLCADSLPPSSSIRRGGESSKWGFCSQNVIWCLLNSSPTAKQLRTLRKDPEPTHEFFEFMFVTQIPYTTKAILFVDYKSLDEFPGFSVREKSRLIHHMHITDVKLLSYDKSGTEHIDLVGSAITVGQLKSRVTPQDSIASLRAPRTKVKITLEEAIKADVLSQPLLTTSGNLSSWMLNLPLAIALGLLLLVIVCSIFLMRDLKRPHPSIWRTSFPLSYRAL